MVHLSSNGEVLGQFEEHAVPGLLADGKIPRDAYFWREGMTEWLPVAEFPRPDPEEPEAAPEPAAAIELKPAVVLPANETKLAVELPKSVQPAARKPFVARRGPGGAAPSGAAPIARAAAGVAAKPATLVAASQPAGGQPAAIATTKPTPMQQAKTESAPAAFGAAGVPTKKRGWLLWLAGLLVLAAAGGGAWWWIANAEPPVIPGSVVLAGDEAGPVEVRVFRRAELAGPWRESLAAADARSAELDGLLSEAAARLREKSVLRDESAGVLKVGEEYNMPDVAELRADHDAKQAEVGVVQSEVEKLQSEKAALLTFEGLLEKVPPPMGTVVADAAGVFSLPPPEEEVVLLATTTSEADGKRLVRAWLEVLELPPEGEVPGPVRFAETNRLDLEEIRRFAAAEAP